MDGLRVAWRSGLKTAECCHLKQAGVILYLQSEALSVNALDKIFPEGTYKLLKTKRVDGYRVQRGKR